MVSLYYSFVRETEAVGNRGRGGLDASGVDSGSGGVLLLLRCW